MSEEKEKKMLERDAFMVLQKSLKVSFLHSGDELGYTDGVSKTVFIAWEHEYYKGLTHAETVYFRKGCLHMSRCISVLLISSMTLN